MSSLLPGNVRPGGGSLGECRGIDFRSRGSGCQTPDRNRIAAHSAGPTAPSIGLPLLSRLQAQSHAHIDAVSAFFVVARRDPVESAFNQTDEKTVREYERKGGGQVDVTFEVNILIQRT